MRAPLWAAGPAARAQRGAAQGRSSVVRCSGAAVRDGAGAQQCGAAQGCGAGLRRGGGDTACTLGGGGGGAVGWWVGARARGTGVR